MASMDWNRANKIAKGEALDAGTYDFVVNSAKPGRSNDGTKARCTLNLSVLSGPKAGEAFIVLLTLSPENPNALSIFMRTIAAFGLGPEFTSTLPSDEDDAMELIANALVGRAASGPVEKRPYNGQERNQFGFNLKPFSGDATTVAPAVPQAPAIPAVPQIPVPVPAPPVVQAPVPAAAPAAAPPF